jgi:hypothetical protein
MMKNIIIFILLFFSIQVFCQQQTKDSIFVLYNGDTELIKMIKDKGSDVRSFRVLWDRYKTKESRDERLRYLREHGGGVINFYFYFSGIKNFVIKNNLNKYKLNTVEDISKRKVFYNSNTKLFFIEKLECNQYKFHETHKAYD